MTDGQRHFVGTWTFNLFFSKGPLSFSLQVSPSVFLLCVDLSFLPRPCPHSFNFLSFPFLFILSAPFHPFISLVHVPPTCFYLPPPSGISLSVWCFLLSPHSLYHGSIIGFPWHSTDLSFITSISSPPVLLSLCSLKSGDVPSLSWMFSNSSPHSATNPFIHASITVTCLNSQRGPASLKHGEDLRARRPLQSIYMILFFFNVSASRCLHPTSGFK